MKNVDKKNTHTTTPYKRKKRKMKNSNTNYTTSSDFWDH